MKERIIGAVVLVLVVVLVVPVFLDGPPNNGEIVQERVPLPGQGNQESRTVVLDRDRDNPVPAATSPEPAAAQTQTAAVTAAPPPQPVAESEPAAPRQVQPEPEPAAAAPAPAATSTSATGMWAVQLGSFGDKQNADRLAAELRKQGFAAFLSQLDTANGELHRVRIGPQKDREAAEAMAERLAKAGHKGQVVPHP